MSIMESQTIDGLKEGLEAKFEVLKTAIHLHVAVKGDQEELDEMNTNLRSVESVLTELRRTMDEERQEIDNAKAVLESLRTERARIEHILANIPQQFVEHQARLQHAARQQELRSAPAGPGTSGTAGSSTAATGVSSCPSIAAVGETELAAVPTYMRGRITRPQVQQFVQLFNRVLRDRQTLLRRNKTALSHTDKQLQIACRRENNAETKGKYFVSDADFGRFGGATLSKSQRQILVLLRHCGRIRQVRGPGTLIRYVLI